MLLLNGMANGMVWVIKGIIMEFWPDEQNKKDEIRAIILRLSLPLIVLLVSLIIGNRGSYGDSVTFWIVFVFAFVGIVWLWRKNKTEFVKRIILAFPFALIPPVILKCFGWGTTFSFHIGMFTFLALVVKSDNWKQHFSISLIMALLFVFFVIFLREVEQVGALSRYWVYLVFAFALFPFLFYIVYLGSAVSNKEINLYSILKYSLKLSAVISAFALAFFLSLELSMYFNLSLIISLVISISISIIFLVVIKSLGIQSKPDITKRPDSRD